MTPTDGAILMAGGLATGREARDDGVFRRSPVRRRTVPRRPRALVEDGVIRALVDVEQRARGGDQVDPAAAGFSRRPDRLADQRRRRRAVQRRADGRGNCRIARAHRREGVTGFLPTVVTDAPELLGAALSAAREAERRAGRARNSCRGPVHRPAPQGHSSAAVDPADARGRRRGADRGAGRRDGGYARAGLRSPRARSPDLPDGDRRLSRPFRGERRGSDGGLRRRRAGGDPPLQCDEPIEFSRARRGRSDPLGPARRLRPHCRRRARSPLGLPGSDRGQGRERDRTCFRRDAASRGAPTPSNCRAAG